MVMVIIFYYIKIYKNKFGGLKNPPYFYILNNQRYEN